MAEQGGGFIGRVVVVTGAGGNLGRAVCERLLEAGARVLGLVRRAEEVAPLEKALAAQAGGRFLARAVELSNEPDVEAAFDAAAQLGTLWGVVNAAGAWDGGRPVSETPTSSFEKMVDANLRSCFVCSRAALRRLLPLGAGRVVNVGAATAEAGVGNGGSAAYAAAKAGVAAFTRALAEEGAPHGIRANFLAPGVLRTPDNRRAMPDADPARWVSLEEAAEAVVFLCAPASAAVNGAALTLPSR